jgi:hypothetical protein
MIRRKRRVNVGTYVDPPLSPLAPIERVVDEGAIIYVAAARMALMNHIIVGALGREHIDYEPDDLRVVVREELHRLADDNDATAERLETSRTVEFESDMDEALAEQKRDDQRRRPAVHRLIAEALRASAGSDAQVTTLVDKARADAVDSMFRAIQLQLLSPSVATDPDYNAERAARISEFVRVDLLGSLTDPATSP